MDTNKKGKTTEVEVMSFLIKRGYSISIPFGDKDRYDQIWDINGKLIRVQVKTSKILDAEQSGIVFNCYTVTNGKKHKYTKDEIDVFATFFGDELYVIPIEQCSSEKKLHFVSKQPRQPNICWAKDYTFDCFVQKIESTVKTNR